eukprot:COSAG01_NODE_1142_length_11533_cov_9.907381_12_plen_195_part_00
MIHGCARTASTSSSARAPPPPPPPPPPPLPTTLASAVIVLSAASTTAGAHSHAIIGSAGSPAVPTAPCITLHTAESSGPPAALCVAAGDSSRRSIASTQSSASDAVSHDALPACSPRRNSPATTAVPMLPCESPTYTVHPRSPHDGRGRTNPKRQHQPVCVCASHLANKEAQDTNEATARLWGGCERGRRVVHA